MHALVVGFFLSLASLAISGHADSQIEVGDVWTFKDAPLEQTKLYIRKIEDSTTGAIVHVSIYPIPFMMRPDGQMVGGRIGHMPFSRKTLTASLIDKVSIDMEESTDFEKGYQQWKDAEGGVFTISPAEAIIVVYSTFGATLPVDAVDETYEPPMLNDKREPE
ncbi:hypothetical protein RYZ27_03405 [Hyphomonas sp. FCG-A18]|uniref:hypothetical protein n=1 Tax=Hyphomonas sp. FCG-A18 TaxID=3080019 RepID=UPI002B2B1DDC|nr:hypothetical protein RYZ27_03405 [Hyphomonas sp. FCG-A18]